MALEQCMKEGTSAHNANAHRCVLLASQHLALGARRADELPHER